MYRILVNSPRGVEYLRIGGNGPRWTRNATAAATFNFDEVVTLQRLWPESYTEDVPTMGGIAAISFERQEQIDTHNYDAELDRQYFEKELAEAAKAYLEEYLNPSDGVPQNFPFLPDFWKPSDKQGNNLTKAGALIAAEIDRIGGAHV